MRRDAVPPLDTPLPQEHRRHDAPVRLGRGGGASRQLGEAGRRR